jgi:hypothetical protein
MKNIFITILSFLVSITAVNGQEIFHKIYNTGFPDIGIKILQTVNNDYLIAGFTYDSNKIRLIRINSFGEVIFNRTYGGPGEDRVNDIVETPDSCFIIVGQTRSFGNGGDELYLLKIDNNGDIIWTKTFGGPGDDSWGWVTNLHDGGFILTGKIDEQVVLIKLDAGGNHLWTKNPGFHSNETLGSIIGIVVTSDGGFLISGSSHSRDGYSGSRVYLIKTNNLGETLWSQVYDYFASTIPSAVIETHDGNYLILGTGRHVKEFFGFGDSMFLIKVDVSGNVTWVKTYDGGNRDCRGFSVQNTAEGGYILSGDVQVWGNGTVDIILVKTNSEGDAEWTKAFNLGYHESGQSVIQTSDRGFAVTGYVNLNSNWYSSRFFLLKTDSLGKSDIVVKAEKETEILPRISYYLNPAIDKITVKKGVYRELHIEITDLNGKIMYSNPLQDDDVEIDISKYKSGMYILKFQTPYNKQIGKIIKI